MTAQVLAASANWRARSSKTKPVFLSGSNNCKPELDYDALFAKVLVTRPAVLGYYFTSENDGRAVGTLPAPVESKSELKGRDGM